MANNAMGMMFMLLLIGGGVVAFVKRCEWFKMCDDKKFRQDDPLQGFAKSRINNLKNSKGQFITDIKTGAIDKTRGEDLDVTVGDPNTGGSGPLAQFYNNDPNTKSKFARISYF
jgi:hypothetical protein